MDHRVVLCLNGLMVFKRRSGLLVLEIIVIMYGIQCYPILHELVVHVGMMYPVSEICILRLIRMASLVYMILVLVNCDVVYGGKGSYYPGCGGRAWGNESWGVNAMDIGI